MLGKLIASLLLLPACLGAAPLAEADFSLHSASGAGYLLPSASQGFTWSLLSSGAFSTVSDNGVPGIAQGNALLLETTGTFQGAFASWNHPVTLRTGETLTLSFSGRYASSPAPNSGGFRFGFTTARSPDESVGVQLGTGSSNNYNLIVDSLDNGGDRSPGSGSGLFALSATASGPAYQPLTHQPFQAILSITRHSHAYTIASSVNGSQRLASVGFFAPSFDSVFFRNGGISTAFLLDSVSVSLTPSSSPSPPTGTGLTARYFSSPGFTGLSELRTDPQIDFDGSAQPPASGLSSTSWSARWTGEIDPSWTGLTRFTVSTPCGVRLWLDHTLVAARTVPLDHTSPLTAEISLVAGKRIPICLELIHQGSVPPELRLEWSEAGQTPSLVPSDRLYPDSRPPSGGGILKEFWTGLTGNSIPDLTGLPSFPDQPSGREVITSLESPPVTSNGNTGTRVAGHLLPPSSGSYRFSVSGSGPVELWLGSDGTPASLQLVASSSAPTGVREWTSPSVDVPLNAGTRYAIELRHQSSAATSHWAVGWLPPDASAYSVIPGSALAQTAIEKGVPPRDALFRNLATGRPRLLATPDRFSALAATIAANPNGTAAQWYNSARSYADSLLSSSASPATMEAVQCLGIAWRLTGNAAYAERAWASLEASANLSSWGGSTFDLSTAGSLQAVSIGYDWFYSYLTPARRETLRSAILSKGLVKGISAHTSGLSWTLPTSNNWNIVCNGAMIVGSLSVGDDTTSRDALSRALASILPVIRRFQADAGSWYEGPDYWYYTMNNLLPTLASLETALGSDFGLGSVPGLSETGLYVIHNHGPSGQTFNFADAASYRIRGPFMFWSARRHQRPIYAWYENSHSSGNLNRPLDALWQVPTTETPANSSLSPDAAFRGTSSSTSFPSQELVFLRGSWNSSRTTFVGAKGGEMGAAHGNLDAGSFVLDALGKRWAVELGYDDYDLPGYFSSNRWTYYRNRTEGQNTLLVQPGSGGGQTVGQVAPILRFESSARQSFAAHDLTPVTPGVSRAWRGYRLLPGRQQVLIQDEVIAGSPSSAWWFMHFNSDLTTAEISPDGRSVTLTQGPERLWLRLFGPQAVFSIRNASPLPSSPNPSGQNANASFRKLAIELQQVSEMRLAVWAVPLSPGDPVPGGLPPISPIASWNAQEEEPRVVSLTPSATLVTEKDGSVDVSLQLAAASSADLTVPLVYGGTATRNADFSAPSSITIPAGETTVAIPISLRADSLAEEEEDLILSLEPGPYSVDAHASVTIRIKDSTSPVILIHDTFDLGASPTADDDPDDPLDAAWSSAQPRSVVSDSLLDSGALRLSPSVTFSSLHAVFPTRHLLASGDTLTLSFDFRYASAPAHNAAGFRFGFFNPAGDGYAAQIATGTGSGLSLISDHSSDNGFGSGGTTSGIASVSGAGISDNLRHRAFLTLVRTTQGITVHAAVDGSLVSSTPLSGAFESFNTLTIRNGSISTPFLIDNVRLESLHSPLDAWKSLHFGHPQSSSSHSSDGADPDLDGYPNLVEYALGFDPTLPDQPLSSFIEDHAFTLIYPAAPVTSEVVLIPEWSENLVTWRNDSLTLVEIENPGETPLRKASIPVSGKSLFLRLKASRR